MKSDGGYFHTMVMNRVKASPARIIQANRISVLELDERIDLISRGLLGAINPNLAEHGLAMLECCVGNIVIPEEDPHFRRMKQEYANRYLKVREEEIRRVEAKSAFRRKAVEARAEARIPRRKPRK
ncbi:MAG: hypothetical protein ACI4OY_12210 [Aristaeellaceae bacterium]